MGLAKGYALPHLPRMPELRGLDTSSFERHQSLPSEIRYKDKAREKQRVLKMKHGEDDKGSTIKYKDRLREKLKMKRDKDGKLPLLLFCYSLCVYIYMEGRENTVKSSASTLVNW